MKFEVKINKETHTAKVKNLSDTDLKRPSFCLCAGKTIEMTIDQAKTRLGDWEDNSFKARKQKEQLGQHRYELKIIEEAVKSTVNNAKKLDNSPTIEVVEFAGLNEEVVEEVQCEGITKSGKRCKRMIPAGEQYCPSHRESNEQSE